MIYLLLFSSRGFVMLLSLPSSRFVKDNVLFMPIQLTGVSCPLLKFFSSYQVFASLLNRSATRIDSFLFLFLNRVLSTFFISVAFFLSIFSTSQGSLVSLIGQRSNLVLPLLFLFRFPSGAILDLGTRSSRSGGVL